MLATSKRHEKLVAHFKSGERVTFKKGHLVIRPQDSPEYIYYIDSGFVKAYSITKYGDQNLHIIRKSGEIFPLIWTFTQDHRDVAYEAMDDVVIWRLPRREYVSYLDKTPDITGAVLELAIQAYRAYAERVNTLEYRTVRERTISFLLSCISRFGTQNEDGTVCIRVPLRHIDIASSTNASREMTSRELGLLVRKNLISIHTTGITIQDPDKLRALL